MFKYIKKYWFFALLAPIFMSIEVLMDLIQPRLMSTIIDEGVLGLSNGGVGNMDIILNVGIRMIGAVVFGGLAGVLSGVFANLCSQNFGNDIRKDCFNRIMSLSFQQTDEFSTGSLVTRVTNDVTQLQNLVEQCIRGFVRTSILFVGGIIFLCMLDISFGVVVFCAVPIVLVSVIFFISKANPMFGLLQRKLDRVNSVVQENVAGARVVKAYVHEKEEEGRFEQANDELVNTQLKISRLFSFMQPITNIVLNIAVVAVIKVGAIDVQAGVVTPGNVMAAITYLSQIMHAIMMLANIFQTISRGAASGKRIKEILDCQPAVVDGHGCVDAKVKGKIEFKNVSFSYPQGSGEKVLEDISLVINPGETFAILGATGSGKSSLVNLIPRFYDTTSGTVLVDEVDVREYHLEKLRNKVAIALQKSELFSGSIKDNILWGKPEAGKDEICHAADIAQASEFIDKKEEGYDTLVAEKGMSLSGGQKQRIAISRAVLKEAEILIFDDSTSALDLKTEAKIYRALNKEYQGMTKIIIAQRIASVKDADRIAVIDKGRLTACGSHDDLLENSDIYREIFNSQLKVGGELFE